MQTKTGQEGIVLIAMVLVVFVTATSLFFVAIKNQSGAGNEVETKIQVREQLTLAKEALISYAINYSDYYISGPGRLPCPDIIEDGDDNDAPYSNGTWTWCDSAYYRHRLPLYTDLPSGTRYRFMDDYMADIDQRFWYAVTPDFAHLTYPNADKQLDALNTTSDGDFSLDGEPDIVAVIIAPGEAVDDQTRPSTNYYDNFYDYLESTNAPWWSTSFVTSDASDPDNFNDQVIGISRAELMAGVTAKVVKEIKTQLDNDHPDNGNAYPADQNAFDTSMSNAITAGTVADWYDDDNWDSVSSYTQISSNIATLSFTDCSIIYTLNFVDGVSRSQNDC